MLAFSFIAQTSGASATTIDENAPLTSLLANAGLGATIASEMLPPLQSLQLLLTLPCWQMPPPPQSLHLLLRLPCWHTLLPPQSLHLLFSLPCSQCFRFLPPSSLRSPATTFTPPPTAPSAGSVAACGPGQARFVFFGGQRATVTCRGAGGLAEDAARRKGLPQSSMRRNASMHAELFFFGGRR